MSSSPPPKPAFDLRSVAWTLTALRLNTAVPGTLAAELDAKLAAIPGLFDDDAVVIDLSPLSAGDDAVDFTELLPLLRARRMRPLAVHGGSPAQMARARAVGLAEAMIPEVRVDASTTRREVSEGNASAAVGGASTTVGGDSTAASAASPEPATSPASAAEPSHAGPIEETRTPANARTMVIDKPLRSGQRLYARGGDIIVLAMVSFGAEVIADGHVHVYAPLRGRAIAGASGDTSARIFGTCMDPQLVCIAGNYRAIETPLPDGIRGHAAQVRLEGERIVFEALSV